MRVGSVSCRSPPAVPASSLLTENKQSVLPGKSGKEEKDGEEAVQACKTPALVANSSEQGSTLRDLLTTTAGKLKLGSTDAGIAFAPVYSTAAQVCRAFIPPLKL